ncbi:hypothetical protein MDA_GLEAN10018109 [Myotis davidii]|uniref:Uncharacterized protein n=1 Tax=Myotis davidii TaxID=225400 RepID=L5LGA6_MYODS|nr:hypothetical protein MDA_GLEAN10018109 [Myotis davidii]
MVGKRCVVGQVYVTRPTLQPASGQGAAGGLRQFPEQVVLWERRVEESTLPRQPLAFATVAHPTFQLSSGEGPDGHQEWPWVLLGGYGMGLPTDQNPLSSKGLHSVLRQTFCAGRSAPLVGVSSDMPRLPVSPVRVSNTRVKQRCTNKRNDK